MTPEAKPRTVHSDLFDVEDHRWRMKILYLACLLALCAVSAYGQCTKYTYQNVRCISECRPDGSGSKYQCMMSGGASDYCSPTQGVTIENVPCVSPCSKKVGLFGEWYECKIASGQTQYCGLCTSRPGP